MQTMKSRIRNTPSKVALTSIILIVVSLACSASKSASSPAQVAGNPTSSGIPTPLAISSNRERTACTLSVSEAPVVNRLRLGMTVDEILALFPGSKDDAELSSALSAPRGPLGNFTFLITPSKYGSAPDFKEVSRITFTLLDGRLSSFTINYNGPQWPDVDKFVEKFVQGKNLPTADQWEPYAGMETQLKTLSCADFSIRIFSGGEGGNMNYVLVEDLEADKKLKERRRKARASSTPGQ
jgi:hypothetical protein